jgi:hypothetical protein
MKHNTTNPAIIAAEKNAIEHLASFEGSKAGYEKGTFARRAGMEGGPMLADFRKEPDAVVYTLKLVNANATDTHTALVCPGIRGVSTQGSIKTGAMSSVESALTANLSGSTTSPGSIEDFLLWIQENPAELLGLQIKSTNPDQSGVQVKVEQFSPFTQLANRTFNLDSDESNMSQNDKISVLDLRGQGVQFDKQTKIFLPVVGDNTAIIKLYFGKILNIPGNFNALLK